MGSRFRIGSLGISGHEDPVLGLAARLGIRYAATGLQVHLLALQVQDPEHLVRPLVFDIELLRPILADRSICQPVPLADVDQLLPEMVDRRPHARDPTRLRAILAALGLLHGHSGGSGITGHGGRRSTNGADRPTVGSATSQKVDAPIKTGYNFPAGCIDSHSAPRLRPSEACWNAR